MDKKTRRPSGLHSEQFALSRDAAFSRYICGKPHILVAIRRIFGKSRAQFVLGRPAEQSLDILVVRRRGQAGDSYPSTVLQDNYP